jgi:RNA polymerase sigma factor (sigma-70 family)
MPLDLNAAPAPALAPARETKPGRAPRPRAASDAAAPRPGAGSPGPASRTRRAPSSPLASRALDELALRARRGEPGAMHELVAKLLVRLRPLVRHHVLARSRGALVEADIDDALQDLVLHIWQHELHRFDAERSGFLTFVSKRLRWHVLDRARRACRLASDPLDDVELELEDLGRDPESLLATHAEEQALLQLPARIAAAADLEGTERLAVVRYDLEGASLAEVARELRVHVSNACRARQRGLRRLARHLEPLAA